MAVPVFEFGPVNQDIIYAFGAGFIIAWLIFGIRIIVLKSRRNREVKELKASLANRIDIETTSFTGMRKEIEELKNKNANLKTSMQNLSAKPGRREKLQLQVYQSAIEKMSVRAPGFAPAWHIVLQECEQEAGRSLDGTIPFIRRIVPSVGTGWADAVTGQDKTSQDGSSGGEIAADSQLSGRSTSGGQKRLSFLSRITGKKS